MQDINILYWILGIIVVVLSINNYVKYKKVNIQRSFIKIYSKVLKHAEDAYDLCHKFIDSTTNIELKHKCKLLQIYERMNEKEDPISICESIDFDYFFKKNNQFDKKMFRRNSDVFVWLAMIFAKAKRRKMLNSIDVLYDKTIKYNDYLNNCLEYRMFKGFSSALVRKKDEDYYFLFKILKDDYNNMDYDRKYIMLYKRIALSYLAYNGELLSPVLESELRDFHSTSVGSSLIHDLGLSRKYPRMEGK